MLISQRHNAILDLLKQKGVVTVVELCENLNISESTIRRDLNDLHKQKKLNKVFGGATLIDESSFITYESNILEKNTINMEEKSEIAKYAVSLIEKSDSIYIDSGTTTGLMSKYLENIDALFVTNGIEIAKELTKKGLNTILLGGNLKLSTDSIIGTQCIENLKKFNFIKGFFGTNGITGKEGFTTADINEAYIKTTAISHCKTAYILSDNSKFEKIYPVSFANISDAQIITKKLKNNNLKQYTNIIDIDNLNI